MPTPKSSTRSELSTTSLFPENPAAWHRDRSAPKPILGLLSVAFADLNGGNGVDGRFD
jgi:hypothetical protein